MLLPYISDPDTGSRIPSMSTGGAAMKAMMNTEVAVSRVGIMITPNQAQDSWVVSLFVNEAHQRQAYLDAPNEARLRMSRTTART